VALVADLYDDINALVDEKLKRVNAGGEAVDLTEWVSQVTESLADMIVFGTPAELQHQMMLYAMERLDHFISENQKILAEEECARNGLH
jgi:hypothetical protein